MQRRDEKNHSKLRETKNTNIYFCTNDFQT